MTNTTKTAVALALMAAAALSAIPAYSADLQKRYDVLQGFSAAVYGRPNWNLTRDFNRGDTCFIKRGSLIFTEERLPNGEVIIGYRPSDKTRPSEITGDVCPVGTYTLKEADLDRVIWR